MKINKFIAIAVVLIGLLAGGLGAGVWLSQQPLSANAAPPAQQDTTCTDDDDIENEADDEEDDDLEENETCDDDDADETGEADDDIEHEAENEANVSSDQIGITADEARAAAEAANPGTKALEVELENENGTIAFEVELDNGLEVEAVTPADDDVHAVYQYLIGGEGESA